MTSVGEVARVLSTATIPPVTTPQGACVRNVLAKLATTPTDHPMIELVDALIDMQLERIYLQVDSEFVARLWALSQPPNPVFVCEGKPRSEVHQMLLVKLKEQFPDVDYSLVSFRERVTFNSLQCVVAVSSKPGADYADCDIDLGGALTDVVGFIRHQAELIKGGVTDHLALRARFLNNPTFAPLL